MNICTVWMRLKAEADCSLMDFLNSVSVFPAKLVTLTVFSGSTVTVITPASLTVSSFLGFVLRIVPDFASDFLSASTIL